MNMNFFNRIIVLVAVLCFSAQVMAQNPFYPKCKIKYNYTELNFGHGRKFVVMSVIPWSDLSYYLNYLTNNVKDSEISFAISDMSRWDNINRFMPLNRFSQYGDKQLNLVLIGNPSLTVIGGNCFEDCTALKSVYIPETVQGIGGNAFKGCTFNSITIPANVKKIADYAFANNPNLVKVIFEGNPELVSSSIFDNTNPDLTIYVKKKYIAEYSKRFPNLHFKAL